MPIRGTSYRKNPRHFICNDCGGVRMTNRKTVRKHSNAGHDVMVNQRAEEAHRKYMARNAYMNSYLGRLNTKIAQEEDAWL